MGLLYSPHTSAGRVPTERGLRLFVDGLLEVGELGPEERDTIEARVTAAGRGVEDVLTQATMMLSGLSRCAGLIVATKQDPAHQAHRIRRRGAGQDARHHRGRRRAGGKPPDRNAGGPAVVRADRSVELSELTAARPHARSRAHGNPRRPRKRTRAARHADGEGRGGRSGDAGGAGRCPARQQRESSDRARRLASSRHGGSAGRSRARAHAVRRHRAQERPHPSA